MAKHIGQLSFVANETQYLYFAPTDRPSLLHIERTKNVPTGTLTMSIEYATPSGAWVELLADGAGVSLDTKVFQSMRMKSTQATWTAGASTADLWIEEAYDRV